MLVSRMIFQRRRNRSTAKAAITTSPFSPVLLSPGEDARRPGWSSRQRRRRRILDGGTSIFNALPPRYSRGSRGYRGIRQVSKVEVVEQPKSKESKGKYRMSKVEDVQDVDVRIGETEV